MLELRAYSEAEVEFSYVIVRFRGQWNDTRYDRIAMVKSAELRGLNPLQLVNVHVGPEQLPELMGVYADRWASTDGYRGDFVLSRSIEQITVYGY